MFLIRADAYNKKEMIFAQGMFNEKMLQEQDIIAIRDQKINWLLHEHHS